MGAINYGTSKYVTLGLDMNKFSSYEYEKEYKVDTEEAQAMVESDIEFMYDLAKSILDDYNLRNFKVSIEYGYYEGFYIDIEPYFDWCLENYEERKEYNAEVTQIKEMLLRFSQNGLVSVYPGWCTGYADEKKTKKDIADAVRQMRKEVKELMTYRQWKKSGKTFQEMFV